MLGIILSLLGSTGFGTVFGGVMGLLNRKTDLKYKRLELEDRDKQRAHELKQREVDLKIMAQEANAKIQVAEMEGSFKAIEKSYEFATPEKGSKMATFSAFVRPFISLSYFVVSSIIVGVILYYAFSVTGITFTPEQWYALTMFALEWLFFMASTAIGWFYAMRSGKAPSLK
jgi:hypothetical protein